MDFSGMTRRAFVATSAAALAARETSQAFAQPRPGGQRRVIIDTDPGVDDAFALLLALRSPELKIEGITPVAGNVPLDFTLPNALRMLEIAGRSDIPVAVGAKAPLMRRLVTATYAHGENGLGGAVFPEPKLKPIADPAPVLIRQIVRKYPGEVTLVTLGPLTNVATALNEDKDLAPMIKGITMMGGSLSGGNVTPAAEFNVYVDPEAARIVFQSGIPVHMVGLDVTRRTELTEAHVQRLEAAGTSVSRAAATIARNIIAQEKRQGSTRGPNMHDPLAMAAFHRSRRGDLEGILCRCRNHGRTDGGRDLGISSQRSRTARFAADPGRPGQFRHAAGQIRAQRASRHRCGLAAFLRIVDRTAGGQGLTSGRIAAQIMTAVLHHIRLELVAIEHPQRLFQQVLHRGATA